MSNRDLHGDGFSEIVAEPPPIGHNKAPEGLAIGQALLDRVNLTHKKLFDRGEELLAAESRMPKGADGKTIICPDETWEKKLTEYVAQLQGAKQSLDVARQAEIEPYRSNMSAVHGRFRDLMDKLVDPDNKTFNSVKVRAERALTKYKSDKLAAERKKADEEAAQKRAVEEATLKAANEAAAKAKALEEEAARKRNPEKKAEATAAAEQARSAADALAGSAATASEQRHEAEQQAALPAAGSTRARSANALSGLQEFVDYRDVKRDALDLDRLRQHIPADAIEQAIRSYMRANSDLIKEEIKNKRQPVRGVEFFINERTRVTK